MSIFAKQIQTVDDSTALKVLFLHGLEGSSSGGKATHLKARWDAAVPIIRTSDLRTLKEEYLGQSWVDMPRKKVIAALEQPYSDAIAAVSYLKPDVVIGSSMGGALLAKLIVDQKYEGPAVFLAPAIAELYPEIELPAKHDAVWVIGELDDVISNSRCVYTCVKSGGSLMVSQRDGHRLNAALECGLIDTAVVTALELREAIIL